MTSGPCYSERVDAALALVARAFRHVRRKGSGTPYLAHLLAVAALVAEHDGDEDQIIAALLHDYLEDIEAADPAELERDFGPRVRRLVEGLSDALDATNKAPWRERKERYLEHLRDAPPELKLISVCDKLHNARSILRDLHLVGDELWTRFSASRDETLWYYRSVADALGDGFDHRLVGELRVVVSEVHRVVDVTES